MLRMLSVRYAKWMAVVLVLATGFQARAESMPAPDKLVFLGLLEAGEFETLNARLSAYQEEFESGAMNDGHVATAFASFSSTRPQLAEQLDRWVERFPGVYMPWLARSNYRLHMALVSRGTHYISETHPEALRGMREYAQLALEDATQALRLNARLSRAYVILLKVAQQQGKTGAERTAFDEALRQVPASRAVRYARLRSLVPWWGGSIPEIEELVRQTMTAFPEDPSFAAYGGFVDFIRAEILRRDEDYWEALRYYDRALSFGELAAYRHGRAQALYRAELDDWGLKDVRRAIELSPQWVQALSLYGRILIDLRDFDRAEPIWDLVFELDPLNPEILVDRSMAYERKREFKKALADLERAEVLGRYHAHIYTRRAQMKTYRAYPFDDRRTAKVDMEKALRLFPENPEFWLDYAGILDLHQEWQ